VDAGGNAAGVVCRAAERRPLRRREEADSRPGDPPRDAPTIFVSTTPAQIIVTSGPPQWTPIAGTSLAYANNSDAALFRDSRLAPSIS
jgi:hypothetical protein